MFNIGKVQIKNRVIAAPMAGVSDKAARIIARSFGCGMAVSEMISEKGLIYGQKKTLELADFFGEERPYAVQIFGSEAETVVRGARILEELGADIIDINMGCPTLKIVRNGEGAALMQNLDKARQIIRAVVNAVNIPVTIKMRRGWEDGSTDCIELAGIAEQEGAAAVALHPRSREQFYSGTADWNMIKAVKQRISLPLIGNGDIWQAEDARRMLEETGCDAVMIARGSMGNPFIFRETVELIENERKISPPTIEERLDTAVKHLDLVISFKGEKIAVREMRKHFSWYIKGMHGAARIRNDINAASTRQEIIHALRQINHGDSAPSP